MLERLKNIFTRKPVTLDHELKVKFAPVTQTDVAYGKMGVYKEKEEIAFADAAANLLWVYTAVSQISETAAMLPLRIYSKGSDELVEYGPQYEMLQSPRTYETPMLLRESMIGSLTYCGNCYIYVEPKKRKLFVLQPYDMAIIADKQKLISGYVYRPRKEDSMVFDPLNIVHARTFHPMSYFYGLSPLQAAWAQVNYLDKDDRFWEIFWEEGGRLQGIFTADGSLTDVAVERLQKQIKAAYTGVRKMQANIVLDNGIKFDQIGVSQKDAQLLDKYKMTREEILAAFKVPPSMAGILDQANYSNMEVQERLFYVNAVLPKLRRIEEALNAHPVMSDNGSLYYKFDLSDVEVLQKKWSEPIKNASDAVKGGVMTPNEARDRFLHLDPLADGNSLVEVGSRPNPFATLSVKSEDEKSPTVQNKPKKPLNPRYSIDQHEIEAKTYDDLLVEDDESLTKDLKDIFAKQKEIVLKNIRAQLKNYGRLILTKDETDDLLAGLQEMDVELINALRKGYLRPIDKFGKRSQSKISSLSGKDARWNPDDPRLARFIGTRSVKYGSEINAETIQMVRYVLEDGFRDGASVSELSEMVSDFFDGMAPWRATRIARTETAAAAQESIEVSYQLNSDVVSGREWITARDNRVRDSHQESNLQSTTVALNENFVLGDGEECPYPLAPGLSAENSINCRCTTLPIVEI